MSEELIPPENQQPSENETIVKKTRKKREPKQKTIAENKFLARQLSGIHQMCAVMFNQPLLILDDDETEKLAESIENVLIHYDLSVDPKTSAILNLAFVAGCIYVPKFILIRADMIEKKLDKLEKKEETLQKPKVDEAKPMPELENDNPDRDWLNSPALESELEEKELENVDEMDLL